MRGLFTLIHRWVGLMIAAFLLVSGLTGAVISWDHELDDLINPHLTHVEERGAPLPPLVLARMFEERNPQAWATFIPLSVKEGEALSIFVQGRVDPVAGQRYELGYNQVFLNPFTGDELGKRQWGAAWPITSETFVSFLYVLHYSLHIPQFWGIDHWGMWFMGVIAILWALDCFVGFYLTLPTRRAAKAGRDASVERKLARSWRSRWAPAWRIKASGSGYRISFDMHRAMGLWTWLALFIVAFTAFSLNFNGEIFRPLLSTFSRVTPSPFEMREPREPHDPIYPRKGFAEIIAKAEAEAAARGWDAPAGSVGYATSFGIYNVGFYHPGDDHGAAGVGPARLYYDAVDGSLLGEHVPWAGTVADIFAQAQFPLHSGRILGLPGRILVSLIGIVVAALSVTGVIIWHRKRRARIAMMRRRAEVAKLDAKPPE
ncbi:MAG: PepSY-associated TM helix domain-containing protein [Alphaproteobacteria bacterium]